MMKDEEKEQVRELMVALVNQVRCNSSRTQEHAAILADVLLREHRTHQQIIIGVIYAVIRDVQTDKVVSRSKNLRGILDFTRRYPLTMVYLHNSTLTGVKLTLIWNQGNETSYVCTVPFASWSVLCDWVSKRRLWYGISCMVTGTLTPSVMKPISRIFPRGVV